MSTTTFEYDRLMQRLKDAEFKISSICLGDNIPVDPIQRREIIAKQLNSALDQIEAQEPFVPKCSICGTDKNVKWVGGYQPYLCDSPDCIPY